MELARLMSLQSSSFEKKRIAELCRSPFLCPAHVRWIYSTLTLLRTPQAFVESGGTHASAHDSPPAEVTFIVI
jgi:hypothetical protein